MNDLRRQYDAHLLPVYTPPPPVFTRGQGAKVWDTEGREYVDFGGGIAVLSLGHAPPPLSAAIAEQAGRLLHTSNLHVNDVAATTGGTADAGDFCGAGVFVQFGGGSKRGGN